MYPELDLIREWNAMLQDLISKGYSQIRALKTISMAYRGVGITTLRCYLFPDEMEQMTRRHSQEWESLKNDPEKQEERKRIFSYKAKYMRARRKIEELVKSAYSEAAPNKELTLRELSHYIEENSEIRFYATTLLTLNEQQKERTGKPLVELIGSSPPTYAVYEDNE